MSADLEGKLSKFERENLTNKFKQLESQYEPKRVAKARRVAFVATERLGGDIQGTEHPPQLGLLAFGQLPCRPHTHRGVLRRPAISPCSIEGTPAAGYFLWPVPRVYSSIFS